MIERAQGEFDNLLVPLSSYISTDEAFLGIKIWGIDYYIDLDNIVVLAFTKKDSLELREITLYGNVFAEGDACSISLYKTYNLKLVYRTTDRNVLIFHGVGYSNKTGFTADGNFDIYKPSSSPIHELNLTVTLTYARDPFGIYGTNKISTSLKITVKE